MSFNNEILPNLYSIEISQDFNFIVSKIEKEII